MKPAGIGIGMCLTVFVVGCARSAPPATLTPVPQGQALELVSASPLPGTMDIQVFDSLPIDSEAMKQGQRVFAKVDAHLRRTARENAPEYYRVRPGTALYVSPTSDRRWLQVRLSRGRSAYVRTDETNAAVSLALAQGTIRDQARLTPKPKTANEADAGDGKSTGAQRVDPEVAAAIERLDAAFNEVESKFEQLESEVAGFQGASENWPGVRDASISHLSALSTEMLDLSTEIQRLSAHSGSLSTNDRNAFQGIVEGNSAALDAIQSARATLNGMTPGEDWSGSIATLQDLIRAISDEMNEIGGGINRLS